MNRFTGIFAIINIMKKRAWFAFAGILLSSGMKLQATPSHSILVTASRVARPIETIPALVNVVEREAIRDSGAMTVEGVFRGLGGIDLQGSGLPGQMTRLNLRGLTSGYQSQRVLVLVDGRRINDPYQGNVEFSHLPVSGLERIELVRGPGSALYGSNAEGGVIQLFTRRAEAGSPYGLIAAAFGDYHTQDYRLEQGAAAGRLDYGVSLGSQQTEGYQKTKQGWRQDWRAHYADAQLGVALGEAGALRFYAGGYAGEGRDASSDRETRRDYQTAEYRWAGDGAAAPELSARMWRNGQRDEYDWFYPGKGIYDLQGLGAEALYSRWANAWNQVTGGAEWRQDDVDIDEVADSVDEQSDNLAVFLQNEMEAGDWRFTLGLRFDHAEDYGGFWSPRAGAVWQVTPEFDLFASVNQAHMAPSLSDRYVKVVYQGVAFIGNPDLDPETLTAYELGFRLRPTETLSVQVAGYYQDLNDSFDFVLTPDGTFRNYNATRSAIYGGEAEARWTMPRGFSSYAALSYTEGTYDKFWMPGVDGNRIAYLAPWKASAGLDYRTAAGSTHGVQVRYTDDRYADAQNSVTIDEAVVADWHSRVRLCDRLFFTLRVRNLFDTGYEELPGVEQPGRWTMVGIEVPLM